jgi:primosomal protein N' (replication factor Y) (superfamily II helicase)
VSTEPAGAPEPARVTTAGPGPGRLPLSSPADGVPAGRTGPDGGSAPATPPSPSPSPSPPADVVLVAVDVPALADQGREFAYLGPPGLAVGTVVRVPLHGRRVKGWVVDGDVVPPDGVRLNRVAKVSGHGPPPDVVALTGWGAWRWAGRRTALLRSGSPAGVVPSLPPASPWRPGRAEPDQAMAELVREARAAGEAVVRLPPAADPLALVSAVLAAGPALVILPSADAAAALGAGLRRGGWPVAVLPDGWAHAAAGEVTVIGARAGAWGPAAGVRTVVVLDAHDGGLVETRAPTWSAWVVAAERARVAGLPCILVSPCPLLEQLQWGRLLIPARDDERRGWPPLEVVDRTADDPRAGLLGSRLVPLLRAATMVNRVLCVLNRKGRVRLLACRTCGRVTTCEQCAAAVTAGDDGLVCRRCGTVRPTVCQACGSTALRGARVGVTKLREELEALVRLPVGEVTAEVGATPATPIVIGTEAVLNRGIAARAVVFLDFDAEMLAPRFRAAEDALGLLARAARVAGRRDGGGRLVVQTRTPDHPVLLAAVRADPGLLTGPDLAVRTELGLPPVSAMAQISGDADQVTRMAEALEGRLGVEVLGGDGSFLLRARDHRTLCDALAAVGRPPGVGGDRLRIEVDPRRI